MTLDEFEKVLAARTPGRWLPGNTCDGVVTQHGGFQDDTRLYYGGELVFESAQGPDRAAIMALNNCADELLAVVRAARIYVGFAHVPEQDTRNALYKTLTILEAKLAGL